MRLNHRRLAQLQILGMRHHRHPRPVPHAQLTSPGDGSSPLDGDRSDERIHVTPTSHRLRAALLAAMCVFATAAVSACQSPAATPCPTRSRPGLAIAVGGRANSPTPNVPSEVQQLVDKTIDNGKTINVIRVDGDPTIACALSYSSDAVNPIAKADDLSKFRRLVDGVVGATRAQKPEADPLAALSRAAAAADTGGTIVLIDSGLQTVKPLDFREPGLIDADPDAVAEELSARGRLPDLSNRAVVLVGIGYTANPHLTLDERRPVRLVQMWETIAKKAGAVSVVTVPTPNTADAVSGVPPVSLVPVPPIDNIKIGCNTESILSNDGKVGFVPGKTVFINSTAARQTLAAYADWLVENPNATASLVGTIAHYGIDEGNGGLALARAERVRDVLVELGARSSQVSARGDGWGPFPSKDAPPSAATDQLNRRVVLTITCG
jgi:OmpA-OmpF porin, OOP family